MVVINVIIIIMLLLLLLLLLLTCDPQGTEVSSKQALELRLQVPPPQH